MGFVMSKLIFAIWIVTAALELFLVTQPVGITGQLALSITVIFALTVIWLLKVDGVWRHIFLALASLVVLRYAYWRTTSTLPPVADLTSFIPGVILYIAEMYCIVMLAISLFVVSDPKRRGPPPAFDEKDAPTVDVFVPSYNESREILALTLSAAKAMEYPADKLNIYLLDDGATDEKLGSADPEIARAAKKFAVPPTAHRQLDGVTFPAH